MIEDGVFWLPEYPEITVRGHLTYGTGQAPKVELVDAITPALRVVSTTTNDDGNVVSELEPADDVENFTIHGIVRNSPRMISLIECVTISRRSEMASASFEDQVLQARYMLRGAHISGDDQLYSAVKVRVANIDEWVGLPGFSVSTGSTDEVKLIYRRPKVPSALTEDGATVRVSESMRRSWPKATGGHITRECWILVENFGLRTFHEISRDYVTPVVSILNLSMGVASPVTATALKVGDDWCSVWHSNITEEATSLSRTRNDFLLPLSALSISSIAKFLDLTGKIGPLAPVVADADSGLRRATLETQVLELTTVAEGLHRSLYPEESRFSKDAAIRIQKLVREALRNEPEPCNSVVQGFFTHIEEPNYKTRLRRLVDVATSLIPGVVGSADLWVKLVDSARNSFAHRTQQILSVEKIDEYYAISQSLRWVLVGVLLAESRVDKEDCIPRIQEFSRYRQYLRNMKSSLPSVFAPD